MDTQSAQELADRLAQTPPQTWLLITWCAAFVLGLALWAFGGRLARPSITISGVILGGSVGYSAAQLLGAQDWLIACVVLAAVVGAVIAWSLFRIWTGVSLGALLGLVVPLCVLAWDGRTVSDVTGPIEAPPPPDAQALTDAVDLDEVKAQASAIGRSYIEKLVELARTVWADLDPGDRTSIITGAGVGALAGLLWGLLLPYMAAALESAIVGALLMLVSGVNLLAGHEATAEYAHWLGAGPRRWVIVLGLITIFGAVLQWIVLRKKADTN